MKKFFNTAADCKPALHYAESFSFHKKKQVGIKKIKIGEKILIEAVV